MIAVLVAAFLGATPSPNPRITEIQAALKEAHVEAWLLCDFRGSNPLAARVLQLPPQHRSRRWCYLVPATGEPLKIVHAIEPGVLDTLPGTVAAYSSWQDRDHALADGLKRLKIHKVAMEYSPKDAIPYVSRIDAGTVEWVRAAGASVVTSADLVQQFEARLTDVQLDSHRRAATALNQCIDDALAELGGAVKEGQSVTEKDVQAGLVERAHKAGIVMPPPDVSFGEHSASPHYAVPENGGATLQAGTLVLIDAVAKLSGDDDIWADITKVAWVGDRVPDEVARVFALLVDARQAALGLLRARLEKKQPVKGAELDRAARSLIAKAGYGPMFLHRLGHSIGREVHGNGANLDGYETSDDRVLLDHTCFSIEPGIYLAGRWGVRSEIDACLVDGKTEVTTGQPQMRIATLLGHSDDVAEAIDSLGPDNDLVARLAAAMELGTYADPRAVRALIAALSDPDPNLREQAARSLAQQHDAASVAALEALLAQEKVSEVRDAAQKSLATLKH